MLIVLAMLMPTMVVAREDELAKLLEQCLLREENSPDSIEYNLQLLEDEREAASGVHRAVYSAILAKLYATRAYSDVTGEWRKRSVQLFREALADPELLYNTRTKDWVPLVKRGKNEKIYGRNMLYVVWRAANEHFADSVMTEQELIDFYTAHGNKKPATVKAEQERLRLENDSIEKLTPRVRLSMAEVYYPGDSLGMTLDTFNVKQVEWKVLDARGKLVGKNILLAPTLPGRYTLELKCKTDVRLEKKPENVLIYATSNRRHLVRETFKDKADRDEELHTNDTVQEKLSLVARFGVTIYFGRPNKKEFQNIVKILAERSDIQMSEEELFLEANKWELSHGGLSGRTAQQFVDYLLGKPE